MQRPIFPLLLSLLLATSCFNTATKPEEKAVQQPPKSTGNKKTITGKVIGISDGDTFRVLTERNETVKVRLYGIDAPEKGQDYGTQSQQQLSSLIFSKPIRVEQKNKDRYGRVVGIAFVDDLNVNEEMLKSGMVWHYRQYDKNERWASMQRDAQAQKAGLWNKQSPTPPWEWRKEKRDGKQVEE